MLRNQVTAAQQLVNQHSGDRLAGDTWHQPVFAWAPASSSSSLIDPWAGRLNDGELWSEPLSNSAALSEWIAKAHADLRWRGIRILDLQVARYPPPTAI